MESLKLAFETITSPFKGFEKLKERRSFWLPFLLTVLISIFSAMYYSSNADLKYILTQQLERTGKVQQLSQKDIDRIVDLQAKFGKYFMPVGVAVSSFLYFLIVAFYLFVMAKIYTTDLGFKESATIVGNAYLVYFISSIVFIVIMLLTNFRTTPIENLMPSNLAYYFSSQTLNGKLYVLFSKIDIFNLWFAFLLGVGFHKFTGEGLTKSLLTVFVPYVLLITVSVLFA